MRFLRLLTLAILILIGTGESTLMMYAQEPATPVTDEQRPQPSIAFYPADESQPGYINIELKPGEQKKVAVVLGNNGEVDFEAVTYAADAITIRNGGFGLKNLEDEQTGPTTWLDYPTEQFATVAGDSFEREFTISVPDGTLPGEYVTGIAMQTADPVNEAATEGMFRFDQYYRTVIGIRVLVPGDLAPSLEFGEPQFVIEGSIPAILVPILNTGNQQTTPSGEIRVTDSQGEVIITAPIQMGRIYGGHQTELWIGLSQPLPDGDYKISVTLVDKDKDIKAELPPTTFAVTASADVAAQAEQNPVTFASATVVPMPDTANLQFIAVDAVIRNDGDPLANAQLTLVARVDGEEVERFPISQSLSLPQGETTVSTRYIPLSGWASGEWEFELVVETVESNGAAVVVTSHVIDATIVVP